MCADQSTRVVECALTRKTTDRKIAANRAIARHATELSSVRLALLETFSFTMISIVISNQWEDWQAEIKITV